MAGLGDVGAELAPSSAAVPPAPTPEALQRQFAPLGPLRRVVQPKVYGIGNAPKGGALFVGNHTIFAFLDLPFMMAELWEQAGVQVRGLGDHAHYAIPGWRDILEGSGMVRGTPENVSALMRQGENVLVFPGGAREVNKRKGEKYKLIWKERLGFARLAVDHGYPIVPFAAVGAEDMVDVIVDENNPLYAKFTKLVRKTTGWPMQPLVRGIGITPIPRPQRLYFWFGEPVDTAGVSYDEEHQSELREVRDRVKSEVEGGIDFLLGERERDPDRGLASRLLRS